MDSLALASPDTLLSPMNWLLTAKISMSAPLVSHSVMLRTDSALIGILRSSSVVVATLGTAAKILLAPDVSVILPTLVQRTTEDAPVMPPVTHSQMTNLPAPVTLLSREMVSNVLDLPSLLQLQLLLSTQTPVLPLLATPFHPSAWLKTEVQLVSARLGSSLLPKKEELVLISMNAVLFL